MSGVHEGRDAVLQALGVVLSHIEGRTKSGNEVKLPGVEIWRMSGGKASRVQSLVDTAAMKSALRG
jgi:ketosteroid isomerase-like protein